MSKKAPAVKSAKGDAASELVLNYIIAANRPCGAIDLSANLKSKVSKTVAAKTLAELAAAGEIVGKAYGKTMIYCAIQRDSDTMSEEDLKSIRGEIDELKVEEGKMKDDLRSLTAQRNSLASQSKTSDLPATLESLLAQCSTKSTHLASLSTTPKRTTAELAALSNSFNSTKIIAQKRRKIGLEVQGMLMEGLEYGKGAEVEFWEEMGCEDIAELEMRRWREVEAIDSAERAVKKK